MSAFNAIQRLNLGSGSVLAAMMVCSSPAWAEVTLTTPEEIIVVAIDNQELRNGLFHGDKNRYRLDAGRHNVAVKYDQIFYHNSGEHDVLRSNIVTLNNVQFKDGMQYRLSLVNAPKTFEQGEDFAKRPTIAVLDAQNEVIAQQTGANSEANSWLGSKLFGQSYDLRQNAANPEAVPAPRQTTTTSQLPSVPSSTPSNNGLSNKSRDQQLIELWQNATPQERQKFTAWLGNQVAQ